MKNLTQKRGFWVLRLVAVVVIFVGVQQVIGNVTNHASLLERKQNSTPTIQTPKIPILEGVKEQKEINPRGTGSTSNITTSEHTLPPVSVVTPTPPPVVAPTPSPAATTPTPSPTPQTPTPTTSDRCGKTIQYVIENFDPKFGLTEQEVRTALRKSESIWEDYSGMNLFEEGHDAMLKIRFQYRAAPESGSYEAGYYQWKGVVDYRGVTTITSESITVYTFEGLNQLVSVLTHEMGHALGMKHVPAEGSIMNATSPETISVPSTADTAEFKRVCSLLR